MNVRALPAPRSLPRIIDPRLAYLLLAALPAAALVSIGRPWAALFLVPAVFGAWGIVTSGVLLRLAYIGTGFSDPMVVTEAARERVLDGLSPYGVGYAQSVPAGAPFPYGPLALLDSIPLELAAAAGLLVLLRHRPWSLAVMAGFPPFIFLASAGNNDYLPAFLLTAGLLGPRWLIGLSVAVKPYTVVFLPLAGWTGLGVAVVGFLPALVWGGLPESLAMVSAMHRPSLLRWLAIPLTLAGFRYGLLACCAAFAALTMTSQWWSLGYLIPLGAALATLERSHRDVEEVSREPSVVTDRLVVE